MPKKSSHFLAKAFPLFLAIFIDGMGLGLLFPILILYLLAHTVIFYRLIIQPKPEVFYLEQRSVFLCWPGFLVART
jgi:hypothetical protein